MKPHGGLGNNSKIFKLVKEAVFGRKAQPRKPQGQPAFEEAKESQVSA